MRNKFISFDFFAMTIIKIKQVLFGQEYITIAEFYYIKGELEKEFNKEDNGILIYSDFNKFDPDSIKVENSIITIVENPLTRFSANTRLTNYFYIIAELIMEYAEKEIESKRVEFEQFKSENNTFEEKQNGILKRLSSN